MIAVIPTVTRSARITIMNSLIEATLNPIVVILRKSGLLAKDLDYHIVRG